MPYNVPNIYVRNVNGVYRTWPVNPSSLVADNGSFIFTGQNASLSKGKRIIADNGSLILSGQNAILSYSNSPNIIISGTGFGTRTSNNAFFWQPFTTPLAATGSGNLTTHGYAAQSGFGSNSYGSTLEVNTSSGRGPGKGALKYNMSFTASGSPVDRDFFPHAAVDTSNTGRGALNSQQIYFSFWMKLAFISGTPNASTIQIKGPRSGWKADSSVDYYFSPPRLSPSYWVNGDGSFAYLYQEAIRTDGADDASEGNNWYTPPWNTGGWNFCEGWMKFNDIGTNNGFYLQRINGYDMGVGYQDPGNCRTIAFRDSTEASKLINFTFLNPGIDFPAITAAATYNAFFTEHYVDTTPQRVIVTNNSNYTASTVFAIQPEYKVWTDSLIELEPSKMNLTGFTSGSQAYLQCFGPNNTVVKTQAFTVP